MGTILGALLEPLHCLTQDTDPSGLPALLTVPQMGIVLKWLERPYILLEIMLRSPLQIPPPFGDGNLGQLTYHPLPAVQKNRCGGHAGPGLDLLPDLCREGSYPFCSASVSVGLEDRRFWEPLRARR